MKPNHKDERGTITDLLVTTDMSVTEITFTEGAIRGNHYHKATKQIDYVVKGKLVVKTDVDTKLLFEGDSITHESGTPHAYQALVPCKIISICFGVRKGDDYSKDTFNLEIPLL